MEIGRACWTETHYRATGGLYEKLLELELQYYSLCITSFAESSETIAGAIAPCIRGLKLQQGVGIPVDQSNSCAERCDNSLSQQHLCYRFMGAALYDLNADARELQRSQWNTIRCTNHR